MIKSKSRVLLWISALAAILLFAGLSVHNGVAVESNILKLLPNTEQDKFSEKAFQQFTERNMSRMVFLVANRDKQAAKESAGELITALKESGTVSAVDYHLSASEKMQSGKYGFDNRYWLLSEKDEALLKSEQFENFSDTVIQQIYSPLSAGLIDLVSRDPFLLSIRFASSASNNLQDMLPDEDFWVINKEGIYYVVISAQLNASAFSAELQQSLNHTLSRVESGWCQSERDSCLYRSGTVFYAGKAQETARDEISTIGTGSILLIIALVIFAFCSIKPLFFILLTIAVGIVTGFVSVLYLFESIHLLTIVFGASLIGVAVDYAFHYFAVGSKVAGPERIRKIFPAITLGLISSVIGYLSLLTAPFPGFRQMGVFCIFGLIAAYLTVVLLLPALKIKYNVRSSLLCYCKKTLNYIEQKVSLKLFILLLIIPVFCLTRYYHLPEQSDDIRQFQNVDIELKTQQKVIESILELPVANQFYLVKGKDIESLLTNIDKAGIELGKLVEKNIIEGYTTISDWFPAKRRQARSYQLYEKLYQSTGFERLIEAGILSQPQAEELKQQFFQNKNSSINIDSWLNMPIGKAQSHLWLGQIEGFYAAIIPVTGISKLEKLQDISSMITFVDKVAKVSDLLSIYKSKAFNLLLLAIGLIFVLLLFRYKGVNACFIISVPLIAIASAIAGTALLDINLSLFNTLALFLIAGIGIDYGLFFAESNESEGNTLLAVMLSATTTLLSFGLLSFSQTPAITAFGVTMLIGISMSLLTSLIIGALIAQSRKSKNENR